MRAQTWRMANACNAKGESWFKKASAAFFYRLLRRLADAPIPADTGDFRLMKRQVVDVLLSMPEQHRFIRGMVAWIGFRQVPVPYQRACSFCRQDEISVAQMIRFAADAITSFSAAPLRLSLYFSLWSVLVAFLLGLYALWQWFTGAAVPGWTSIAIIVLAFGSMQMFCLGIMGEYLGRIYTQSKQRPLFVIRSIQLNEPGADASGRAVSSLTTHSIPYDGGFFDYISIGSRRSAAIVAPLVLKHYQANSVADIGCGRGAWLPEWQRAGVTDYIGVDGDYIDRTDS